MFEAGIPASAGGRTGFWVYVEGSGDPGQVGSVWSGVAITNTSGVSSTVTLELSRLDGSAVADSVSLVIPASGQAIRFVDQLFGGTGDFAGFLRVTATADIAVVGLRVRINEQASIKATTLLPVDESNPMNTARRYFPLIVNSGGWSTQFILGGIAGQPSSGSLGLFTDGGMLLQGSLE